jgi:N-acetylneuraminic acid mutarotase
VLTPLAIGALLLSAAVATAHPAAAGQSRRAATPRALKPEIRQAVKHDTSAPLRTMRLAHPKQPAAKPRKPRRPRRLAVPHARNTAATTGSALLQRAVTADTMPAPSQSFDGVGNLDQVAPSDAQGDVGKNDYVQMVNLSFAVWSKQGTLRYGPVPNTTLWQGFGGTCEGVNGGDPITMYDESADRWFMSQLGDAGDVAGFHECIAVSQTSDPTGAWNRYDFLFSQTTLNDYPKFGIWPDAYYVSANEFLDADTFTGVSTIAFERTKMLAGQDARQVTFHIGTRFGSLLPSDAEGAALGLTPPPGAPDPFLMFDDDAFGFSPTDRILMWDFQVDWANPVASTFGNKGDPNRFIETAPFDSNMCDYSEDCIRQPGTQTGLDAIADRLMYRASYRNFGDHQSIVLNHTVDVDGTDHAGVRWYQLNATNSTWSLAQQGTYAPDGDNRWMGSAALDASGDIAVGYSVSSSTTFPSIRMAGRLAGDPPGELAQGESTLIAGRGSQTDVDRWGDYSAMQLDPNDGCTFWFTSEYLPTTSGADWHTRIGWFKFPSCTAGPHGALSGTVTDAATHQPIAGALLSTGAASTQTDPQGHYHLTLPVGTYTVTVSAFGYVTKTVPGAVVGDGATVTIDAALAAKPLVHVTGTVTYGSGHGWPLYARIDITGRPGAPTWTDPATGHYSVDLPQDDTYTLKIATALPGYQVVNDTVVVGTANVTHNVAIPTDASCSALGYGFVLGAPALDEPFDAPNTPAGWTVVDDGGDGLVWRFDDPGGLGNLTGGTGSFAEIDSDAERGEDSSLVSPVLDLSDDSAPVVRFRTDYRGAGTQAADVDVSVDGGQTWSNAWHRDLDSVQGPALETAPIPEAAGQSAVQVRFHFTTEVFSGAHQGWQVDDVTVQNRTCRATPGGLLVGTVDDANTGAGVNNVTVASADEPAVKATTNATPDDANLGDGYYSLFSSAGSHQFSAAKAPYLPANRSVVVVGDSVTRTNFTLNAARLAFEPRAITSSQVLGATTTRTVKITNTGTAPTDLDVSERAGAFQLLGLRGSQLKLVRPEEDDLPNPGWLGVQDLDGPAERTFAGPPKDPTWSTIAPYPVGITDNAADYLDGKVYSVAGVDSNSQVITAVGYVYDVASDSWSSIADLPVAREKPSAAFLNRKLYVADGWDGSGVPLGRVDVYDPGSNNWSTPPSTNPHPEAAAGSAVVDDKLYLVGGCADADCTPSSNVMRYDPVSDTWDAVARYPHNVSWLSCGAINQKVYCAGGFGASSFTDGSVYDPKSDSWSPIADMPVSLWGSAYASANGLLVISGGLANGAVTNQGFAYDPSTDSWSPLPNAQFPRFRGAGACGFFKVGGSTEPSVRGMSPDSEGLSELNQCGATDVPWLSEDRTAATLQPGQSVTVTATMAAAPELTVTQPGDYAAQLVVGNNTPYREDPINVTMTVTPPKTWGNVAGTVTGVDCKANSAPLRGVQVQANGSGYTFSLATDQAGRYAFWAPAKSSPFQVIASKDKWIAQAVVIKIKAGATTRADFVLHPVMC